MTPAAEDVFKTRVQPLLTEIFDGFVIMGYATDADGKRTRSIGVYLGKDDAAIADGLQGPILYSAQWGTRQ